MASRYGSNAPACWRKSGRTVDARDAYIELLSREPAHRLALNNLGTLLHETRYCAAARTAFAEAVARYPDDAMGYVNLANALRENGSLTEAREFYETALRLQPDHAEAHQGLGFILAESGDQSEAARHRPIGVQKPARAGVALSR